MPNRLILRSTNSPFTGQFTDINLGKVLSHQNLDDNFIYLKGNLIYDGAMSGSTLVLHKIDGTTIDIDINLTGGTGTGDTYVVDAHMSGNTLVLERNDSQNVTVELTGLTADLYTNPTPTPTTIGGIAAGSTFSAETMQEMWDSLLYPYQYPAFTTFNRSALSSTYELGQVMTSGPQTFTWSTSNSSNVGVNTVKITESTTSTVLLSASTNDGTELLNTSSYVRTTAGSTLLYQITAQNTQSGSFSRNINRTWLGRWYYGTDGNATLTVNDITGGTLTTQLTSGVVNSFVTWAPAGAEYGYLVIPNYLAQPTDLRDSVAGCFGTNIPYISQGTISFNNVYGVSQTYNVYRSVNAFNSSVNAWLCS